MTDNSAPTPANANGTTTENKENGAPSTTPQAAPTNNVEPPLVSINKPADTAANKPAETSKQTTAVS